MDKDLDRFRELSFLFACGKLDEDETAWMQRMLRRHPQWEDELDADRALVAQARIGLAERYREAPPLVSLDEVLRACAPAGRTGRQWVPDRLTDWLQQCWRAQVPAPWLAGAAAMLAVSVTLHGIVPRGDAVPGDIAAGKEGAVYRGAEPAAPAGPVLKAVFDDKLGLGELRVLLAAQHLRVVRGPDEQGIVWLAVTEGDAARALAALRAQPGVLDVQLAGGAR